MQDGGGDLRGECRKRGGSALAYQLGGDSPLGRVVAMIGGAGLQQCNITNFGPRMAAGSTHGIGSTRKKGTLNTCSRAEVCSLSTSQPCIKPPQDLPIPLGAGRRTGAQ